MMNPLDKMLDFCRLGGALLAEVPVGRRSETNPVIAFMPLILMFVIFYFLLIRPQQKKEKDRKEMLKNLKKGDRVITTGGMIGTVMGIKDEEVVLRVGDGDMKIEFLKSAISHLKSNA